MRNSVYVATYFETSVYNTNNFDLVSISESNRSLPKVKWI